jgi:hypothetical protein
MLDFIAIFEPLYHTTNETLCTLWSCVDGHEAKWSFAGLRHDE